MRSYVGTPRECYARALEDGITKHERIMMNGMERVYYGNNFMGTDRYDNMIRRSKEQPVEVSIYKASKLYDRKKGLRFDLSVENVQQMRQDQGDRCEYCQVAMDPSPPRLRPTSLTIERKDATLGHTKDNCVLCCWDCNVNMNVSRTVAKMRDNSEFRAYIRGVLRGLP